MGFLEGREAIRTLAPFGLLAHGRPEPLGARAARAPGRVAAPMLAHIVYGGDLRLGVMLIPVGIPIGFALGGVPFALAGIVALQNLAAQANSVNLQG